MEELVLAARILPLVLKAFKHPEPVAQKEQSGPVETKTAPPRPSAQVVRPEPLKLPTKPAVPQPVASTVHTSRHNAVETQLSVPERPRSIASPNQSQPPKSVVTAKPSHIAVPSTSKSIPSSDHAKLFRSLTSSTVPPSLHTTSRQGGDNSPAVRPPINIAPIESPSLRPLQGTVPPLPVAVREPLPPSSSAMPTVRSGEPFMGRTGPNRSVLDKSGEFPVTPPDRKRVLTIDRLLAGD